MFLSLRSSNHAQRPVRKTTKLSPVPLPAIARRLTLAATLLAGCAPQAPPRIHQPEVGTATVMANGMEFAYFAEGDPADPLVLLVHGFPDTAHAWDELRPQIAAQGYYVVSPFTRGYAPSMAPSGASYDARTLGEDVLALIDAFGREDADVVGHDWGALAGYSAAALDPSKVRTLTGLAIPHPGTLKIRLRDLHRTRHFVALRKKNADRRVERDDYAGIVELYERWSPTWDFSPADVEAVKNTFAADGSLRAALGYYRDLSLKAPDYLKEPTQVPVLVIAGIDDGTTPLDAYDETSGYGAGRRLEQLQAGHFPHREQPEEFLRVLLAFLAEHPAAAKPG